MNPDDKKWFIPPVYVEAEKDVPPPAGAFQKRPVEKLAPGDLVMLGGDVFRIKAVRTHGTSPKRTLTLRPVLGGRVEQETWFNREWLLSCKG